MTRFLLDVIENKDGKIICEFNHQLAKEKNLPDNIHPSPCYKKAEYHHEYLDKYYCEEHYDDMSEVVAEMLR